MELNSDKMRASAETEEGIGWIMFNIPEGD